MMLISTNATYFNCGKDSCLFSFFATCFRAAAGNLWSSTLLGTAVVCDVGIVIVEGMYTLFSGDSVTEALQVFFTKVRLSYRCILNSK